MQPHLEYNNVSGLKSEIIKAAEGFFYCLLLMENYSYDGIFLGFLTFPEKWSRLPGPVFVVFWDLSSENRISECPGRYQKEPRRKVTQIRGGITSRSAFFARFVPI